MIDSKRARLFQRFLNWSQYNKLRLKTDYEWHILSNYSSGSEENYSYHAYIWICFECVPVKECKETVTRQKLQWVSVGSSEKYESSTYSMLCKLIVTRKQHFTQTVFPWIVWVKYKLQTTLCAWISVGAFMPQDVGEPINLPHNRLYACGLFHWLEGSDGSS